MIEFPLLTAAYLGSWYAFAQLKLKKPTFPVLTFHDIDDKLDFTITRVTPSAFARIIDFLKVSGYTGTSVSGAIKAGERSIMLTFDDGWQGFMKHAYPILKQAGFSATLFVVSGYAGKPGRWDYGRTKQHLSWQDIRELSDNGIEIGSHSHSHVDLRPLKQSKLELEISGSKKIIEDMTGRQVKYFSYPYGRFNDRLIEAVADAGYARGFAQSIGKGMFACPRQPVYIYDTPYSIQLKIARNSWLERCKGYINNSLAGGTIILRRLLPPPDPEIES